MRYLSMVIEFLLTQLQQDSQQSCWEYSASELLDTFTLQAGIFQNGSLTHAILYDLCPRFLDFSRGKKIRMVKKKGEYRNG